MDEKLTIEIEKFYENYKGAQDLRSPEEKALDFLQTEFVAAAAPVEWKEKKDHEWRSFPVLNQFFTFKCVAFTVAKLAMINFWLKTQELLHFSPNSIYDYRVNKPQGGMVGDDAFKIWKERGISLEAVCKSAQVQESDPFTLSLFAKEVAKGFRLGEYITIPNQDFDRVASTIQTTGKGVMVWFYFTSREWSRDIPRVQDALDNPYVDKASRHSVTAVDFGLKNGVEYIRIEDSAHFGGKNIRYITREFFGARNFLIKYPMHFNYEEGELPPALPKLTKTLRFGMTDPEVNVLQQVLQKQGLFPANVTTTNNFGSVTLKGVKDFQKRKGLSADGVVGPLTRAELNKLI